MLLVSQTTASNGRITGEKIIWKEVEGSGHGLYQQSPGETEENP
jgi:hypothetical protein